MQTFVTQNEESDLQYCQEFNVFLLLVATVLSSA